VGPCNHGIACPWVVDGEDSLQIWRVAMNNILNKQSWTADKSDSPAWGLGKGLTNPLHKKHLVMKCYTGP